MEELLIECSPGISGDMLLGAFHDLGVPKDVISKMLKVCQLEESKLRWKYLINLQKEIGKV